MVSTPEQHHLQERAYAARHDYIGVGVGAVIVDDAGRLFLARRGPQPKNERGLWEFPGGAVAFDERLADALRRAIREECGCKIAAGELLDLADHLPPAERQHWVSPSYLCRIVSGTPSIREPAKCQALAVIAWFAPDELPAELTEVTRVNLASYLYLGNPPDFWVPRVSTREHSP